MAIKFALVIIDWLAEVEKLANSLASHEFEHLQALNMIDTQSKYFLNSMCVNTHLPYAVCVCG